MPTSLDQIVESQEAERLATGFSFTEGPLWHPDGYLLFVNNRINVIYRLAPGGEPEVVRENSGGANGLTFDLQGRVIMCDGDDRQITRWERDGSITVIADSWDGKRLHRPNDVVCRSDGSIYFTNPGLRLAPEEREIEFHGIHRIAPDGTVSAVITDLESPNGLTFSRTNRSCTPTTPDGATSARRRRNGERSARTSTSGPTTWRLTGR